MPMMYISAMPGDAELRTFRWRAAARRWINIRLTRWYRSRGSSSISLYSPLPGRQRPHRAGADPAIARSLRLRGRPLHQPGASSKHRKSAVTKRWRPVRKAGMTAHMILPRGWTTSGGRCCGPPGGSRNASVPSYGARRQGRPCAHGNSRKKPAVLDFCDRRNLSRYQPRHGARRLARQESRRADHASGQGPRCRWKQIPHPVGQVPPAQPGSSGEKQRAPSNHTSSTTGKKSCGPPPTRCTPTWTPLPASMWCRACLAFGLRFQRFPLAARRMTTACSAARM